MTTPSSDDKILQLVRAILDAVDTRLASVRQEFATAVQQMEQRHRQVLDALAVVDRRINALQNSPTAARAAAPATSTTVGPTLRADPATTPATGPATAPDAAPPAGQGDQIDLAEVTRLVEERLANLTLPSLDQQPGA